jgi:(2Fe-2S) ferredoxin
MPLKPEVMVCVNRRFGGTKPSCAERGSEALARAIEQALAEAGLEVPVTRSVCQNFCLEGPAMRVLPGPVIFKEMTLERVPALVAAVAQQSG